MNSALDVIVVHHDNYPDVLQTVTQCLGLSAALGNLVVVDNTERADISGRLRCALPPQVQLVTVENLGYGDAVNKGLRHLDARPQDNGTRPNPFVLVLTHEVRISPVSIKRLKEAMEHGSEVAAVGPVLYDRSHTCALWSAGGSLTPVLRRPRHIMKRPEVDGPLVPVQWLDGAAVLYRREALPEPAFDPIWKMYYEETDLHLRLQSDGWIVAVHSAATALQATGGTSPYFKARNSLLFARRFAPTWTIPITVVRECVALAMKTLLRHPRQTFDAVRQLAKGVRDGLAVLVRDE